MKKALLLPAALAAAAAQVVLTPTAANAYELSITITGAGQVTETTPADLVGDTCVTTSNNPTGTLGASCSPGTPSGTYAWGWTVRYVATAKPGYRFARWESAGSGIPVICDGATTPTHTGSACQFTTFDNLQTRAVFVDDTAPTMASLTGPNQPVSGPATFTFAATSDPTFRRFQCQIPGQHPWLICASGHTANPPTGTYSLQVRAEDWSGNLSPVSTWTWTVDKLAPETSLLGGPSGTVAETAAEFTFTANESVTFSCTLDGVSVGCGSPKAYGGLGQGVHTFAVAARDLAGNVDPTPATRTWTVSTPVPPTAPTTPTVPTTPSVPTVPSQPVTVADTVRPVVTSAKPTGKRVPTTVMPRIRLSEAMRERTVEAASKGKPKAFFLKRRGVKVPATVTYRQTSSGAIAVLDPVRRLRSGTSYTVVVTSGALDSAGNPLVAKTWKFRTRS